MYIAIGLFISMALSEIDKSVGEEQDDKSITNHDRVIYIIIWPFMLGAIIYYLLK